MVEFLSIYKFPFCSNRAHYCNVTLLKQKPSTQPRGQLSRRKPLPAFVDRLIKDEDTDKGANHDQTLLGVMFVVETCDDTDK